MDLQIGGTSDTQYKSAILPISDQTFNSKFLNALSKEKEPSAICRGRYQWPFLSCLCSQLYLEKVVCEVLRSRDSIQFVS